MSSRERILASALELFNDRGSAMVSTNHIAGRAGVSPGNLYYHFRNKDEIIRSLFDQMDELWSGKFSLPPEGLVPSDLETYVAENYRLIGEYRFIYRELAQLVRDDDEIARKYRELRRRGYEGFSRLLDAFASAGIIRPPASVQERNQLADLCWMVSEHLPTDLELRGEDFDLHGVEQGIALLRLVLQPYLLV